MTIQIQKLPSLRLGSRASDFRISVDNSELRTVSISCDFEWQPRIPALNRGSLSRISIFDNSLRLRRAKQTVFFLLPSPFSNWQRRILFVPSYGFRTVTGFVKTQGHIKRRRQTLSLTVHHYQYLISRVPRIFSPFNKAPSEQFSWKPSTMQFDLSTVFAFLYSVAAIATAQATPVGEYTALAYSFFFDCS